MTDCFHCWGSFSLFQIELISLGILEWIVEPHALIDCAWTWSTCSDLYLFSFSIGISALKALGSDVSISVCPPSLIPCTFNKWQKWFLHLFNMLCESAIRSPLSSCTITYRLVILLKFVGVSYKFLTFSFLLFVSSSLILPSRSSLLYVPDMSVSFTSDSVQIIYIRLVWML